MHRSHIDDLTHSVIGAFFEVYNTLGFGVLEHVYTLALDNYLKSTKLEAGLLFHFGPEPSFFRANFTNKMPQSKDL